MTEKIISLEGLSCTGRKAVHLKDITFSVYRGEIFSVLGPDGSGKTTLLKVLAGLNPAFQGNAVVLGASLKNMEKVRPGIGYVSQTRQLYEGMTVHEILRFCASLYKKWNVETVKKVTDWLDIKEQMRIKDIRESAKSLLYTALTLGGTPEILLIDEPMEGLDDQNRERMKSLLLDYMDRENGTILTAVSSIGEMAGMMDRFAVMKKGRIIYLGSVDEAMERYCKVRIVPVGKELDLFSLPGVYNVERENRSFLVRINHNREEAINALKEIPNDFMDMMPMSIQEIYMEILKEEA